MISYTARYKIGYMYMIVDRPNKRKYLLTWLLCELLEITDTVFQESLNLKGIPFFRFHFPVNSFHALLVSKLH